LAPSGQVPETECEPSPTEKEKNCRQRSSVPVVPHAGNVPLRAPESSDHDGAGVGSERPAASSKVPISRTVQTSPAGTVKAYVATSGVVADVALALVVLDVVGEPGWPLAVEHVEDCPVVVLPVIVAPEPASTRITVSAACAGDNDRSDQQNRTAGAAIKADRTSVDRLFCRAGMPTHT
jgi:hypothetical protein